MASLKSRSLLEGLLTLFHEFVSNSQPVFVLLLVRMVGDRLKATIPFVVMAAVAAIAEGICSLVIGVSFESQSILYAIIGIQCVGPLLSFLFNDPTTGFVIGFAVYGVGIGVTRALTSSSPDDAFTKRRVFDRQIGNILSALLSGPTLLFLEDTLGLKGAVLIMTSISMNAMIIADFRARNTAAPKLHGHCEPENVRTIIINEAAVKGNFELKQIESPKPLPLIIDGKLPFSPQRKHQSQDFGYRQRMNSCAERHLNLAATQQSAIQRQPRRRLNTEPANTDIVQSLANKITIVPERSISVGTIPGSDFVHTTMHRRSVSQESVSIMTPIQLPVPPIEGLKSVIKLFSFAFLVFTVLCFSHLWMVSLTMLDFYVDRIDDQNHFSKYIMALCMMIIFYLSKLIGTVLTDSLTRLYDLPERSFLILSTFIAGITLLSAPYLNRSLGFIWWTMTLGIVGGNVEFLHATLVRGYMQSRIASHGRALLLIIYGCYVGVASPLLIYYFEDKTPSGQHYNLAYQVFGLLQLAASFLWLLLEPLLDKSLPDELG